MVLPDPKALSRVEQPESLLKDCQNIFVRHGLCETFVASRIGETQLYCKAFLSAGPQESKRQEEVILKLICRVRRGRDCSPSILTLDPSRACWRGVMSAFGH